MQLYVQVVEARNLIAKDPNGFSDPFVRLALGATKSRTVVVHKNLNPSWHEEFFFNVSDLDDELKVTVWDQDRFSDDFLGQMKIPVSQVLNADKQTLSNKWFPLQKRSEKSKNDVSGEIKLEVSLIGRKFNNDLETQPSRGSARVSPSAMSPPRMSLDNRFSSGRTSVDDASSVHRSSSTASSEAGDMVGDLDTVPLLQSESPRIRGPTVMNPDSPLVREAADLDKSLRKSLSNNPLAGKFSSIFHNRRRRSKKYSTISPSSSVSSSTSASLISGATTPTESSMLGDHSSESGDEDEELVPLSFFQDDEKSVGESPEDLPPPLPQGILLDQPYAVSMKEMNALIFKPESPFIKQLGEVQKTTEYIENPWKKCGSDPMKRTISYRKAPTALVSAVVAAEEQTYLRADDKGFAVLCVVATPDVPYGKCFLCEVLFVITPGLPTETGEKTCNLQISWRLNFVQSTMASGFIVKGANGGLKESFAVFAEVMSQSAKPLDGSVGKVVSLGSDVIPRTDWQLAKEYFGNYTVLLTVLGLLFVLLHIFLSKTRARQGLEFWGVDLPDSLGELLICALITRQVERVGRMGQKFLLARLKANDHGVKAQGDGWLLTIALVEAENLYSLDTDNSCDPYVVFTCNGKIRTSSVILGSCKPQWKEVYEFDATEDPPSTLDIEVFDYDGPFSQAESLGHASINFLKTKEGELSDMWLPLVGKMATVHGCKIHLRVVLTNTKDVDFTKQEYMGKVEKEANTKLVKRSPKLNSQFQKLFALPSEEFLINDYACAIKKKIPIQGRLFLSPRQLGFYSNLFGHKTKFSFLWEDIEEIKEVAPSRGVLLYPSITITLRKDRGHDARSGSKGVDYKGRLRFQFLSFVKPGPAFRTIIALWKNRTLSVEQQMDLIASVEAGDGMKYAVADRQRQVDENQAFLGVEDAHMSELASMDSSLTVKQLHYLLEKGELDKHVMQLFGVNNYKSSHWEMVGDDPKVTRRQVSYTLNRQQCRFGSAVTSIQQKTISDDTKTGLIEEVMTLHDVPFGDHFQVQVRKEIETTSDEPPVTHCKIYAGVAWHKSAGFQKKITKNILRYMTQFLKDYSELVKKVASVAPPEVMD
ncbi:hypothetical protein MPTK1_4g06300 [Marchantia polymorpha subsp. ruderalis]|uniref:C2 and GRAM domain-containing protein n=2 Tax=Marchantia polymorpha TaxID=3197 RepID=A0AAF6B6Y5_MARPO|nr:hypothetical protein MARPO_0114s0023 [Marchantia polymorpha]BBN07769.1 hypothetical protein Mp_4g06300 [Marchantia polymorpha subsp. ruderalis]|eukprot:PTQ31203.1 hypothetical protein MARPO_0114s0023 [Marchantia polymorpha]